MTTKGKYTINGGASRWKKPGNPVSKAYRLPDSKCDCFQHVGKYTCLIDCPYERCLHDSEVEYESSTEKVAVSQVKRKSVYDDVSEEYFINGR